MISDLKSQLKRWWVKNRIASINERIYECERQLTALRLGKASYIAAHKKEARSSLWIFYLHERER